MLTALLESFTRRINDGAEFQGPGFWLGAISPTPVQTQRERLAAELTDDMNEVPPAPDSDRATEELHPGAPQPETEPDHQAPQQNSRFHSNSVLSANEKSRRAREIFDSTTLGLRYLSDEIGKTVLPQVRVAGHAVDGAVISEVDGGVDAIVDVRFIRSFSQMPGAAKAIRSLRSDLSFRNQENSARFLKLIAVVVVSDDSMVSEVRNGLLQHTDFMPGIGGPIELHVYSLEHLRNTFGVSGYSASSRNNLNG